MVDLDSNRSACYPCSAILCDQDEALDFESLTIDLLLYVQGRGVTIRCYVILKRYTRSVRFEDSLRLYSQIVN